MRRDAVKIAWVSPEGAGKDTALRLREQGHTLISWPADVGVPLAPRDKLASFCRAADLVVVDGPFPCDRTIRSWKPSVASLFVDELRRKYRVKALGPTPTIDLLCGDQRYFKKWCRRLSITWTNTALDPWESGGWFDGKTFTPTGPYLESWKPLFKSVGFRGWWQLTGVGEALVGCDARWNPAAIPDGREAEFLLALGE